MPTIACVECEKVMTCSKNGVLCKVGVHNGYDVADRYQCPRCGKEVISLDNAGWVPDSPSKEADHIID